MLGGGNYLEYESLRCGLAWSCGDPNPAGSELARVQAIA